MQLNPYLFFNGQCEAAFKFYEQCLDGKIVAMMRYGDSPVAEQTPSEWQNKIMHIALTIDDMELMGSDAMPEHFKKPQGFSLSLNFNDAVQAERIFYALAESGTINMPLEETFWATRFGMLVDQFGTPWMINCSPAT